MVLPHFDSSARTAARHFPDDLACQWGEKYHRYNSHWFPLSVCVNSIQALKFPSLLLHTRKYFIVRDWIPVFSGRIPNPLFSGD